MLVLRTLYLTTLCAHFALAIVVSPVAAYAQAPLDSAQVVRAQSPDAAGYAQAGDRSSALPYDGMPRPPVQPVPVSRPVAWPGTPVESYAAAQHPAGMHPQGSSGALAAPPPITTASYADSPPATPLFQPPAFGTTPMVQTTTAPSPVQTAPLGPAPVMHSVPIAGQASAPQFSPSVSQPPAQHYAAPPQQQAAPVQPLPQTAAPIEQGSQTPDLNAGNLQILPSRPQELTDAQIVARVGSQVILSGDVRAIISETLAARNIQVPKEQQEEAFAQAGRQVLKQLVESKLIYNDAIHTIPAEGMTQIESKVNQAFDAEQLPELMKTHKVSTRQELDAKLRERGNSLERARRNFFEKTITSQWLRQSIKIDEELPHADVLGYYQQHIADYEYPAKAHWEELMVRFDRFPDKAAAYAELGALGNDVMRGVPFDAVAKQRSHGGTASHGGVYDWTTKGSLVATNLDEAIFSLPVGALSQIIETQQGFHIIRVIERKDAGRTPFTDAQPEIKKKLKDERLKNEIEKYVSSLRKRTPIWTIYDEQPGGLEGLADKD